MHVVSLGECMLEVKVEEQPQALFGYGGDTFNTAYYLTLLGIDCAYTTALGDDHLSEWLLEQWREIGISTDLVKQLPNSNPGIYTIHTDAAGERNFNYWRQNAAVKSLFEEFDLADWLSRLEGVKLFYFSLISVAVLTENGRKNLLELLRALRQKGVRIAFDNNYRARLWSDRNEALVWLQNLVPLVDIYLPSLEDEVMLYQLSKEATEQHLAALRVEVIVVKDATESCKLIINGQQTELAVNRQKAVDTTAAGDSFNAGFLAAMLKGHSYIAAVNAGCLLAAQVVLQPGAIVPVQHLRLDLYVSETPENLSI